MSSYLGHYSYYFRLRHGAAGLWLVIQDAEVVTKAVYILCQLNNFGRSPEGSYG